MASLELLPYFWSLNTIPVVKILNFDYGHLSHPPYSWQNSVKGVKLLGGMGDSVKVYHIDRDISFGNRHSKMSEPKDVLQKFCKSSHWCSTLPCGTRVVLSLPLASEPGCHQWGTTSWWRWTFGDLASISGLASDPSWLWYNHAMFCFPYQL